MTQQTQNALPVLLTETEAAKLIGFSIRTVQKWRMQGRGPKFVKVSSRAIRYRREDVDAWIESRLRSSTSDPGNDAA